MSEPLNRVLLRNRAALAAAEPPERQEPFVAASSGTRSEDELAAERIEYTRTRVVQVSPEVLARNRIVTSLEPGPVGDAYKILAIQVIQRLRERGSNALAVLSPGDGEGKTLTAVNLAISLAAEVDYTVLLVDADLRAPAVHACFGLVPEAGLSDHLLSRVPLDRILINPGIDRLVLLPGGRPVRNSVEMLGCGRMQQLVQELKSRYAMRLIVFDLPPVLSAADTLAFAPLVDAAVMVIQENATTRDAIERAAQMLNSVDLIGTVLNRSSQTGNAKPKASGGWWSRMFGGGASPQTSSESQ